MAFSIALSMAVPAGAEIPAAIDAMIREAARGGDNATLDAVVKVAKATNPDDAEAIGALGARLLGDAQARIKQEQEQQLASRTFLDGWKGEGQAGFALTSGNTRETSAILGLSMERPGIRVRYRYTALLDFLRTNGITTRQRYATTAAVNFVLRDGLYVVGTLGWERDTFAGYARRFGESLGVGYRAIDTRAMTLNLEAGPALRQTLFVDGHSEDEVGARGSLDYRWTLRDGVQFTEVASVVNGGDDTTLISTTALTARLIGKLSGRMSFNVQKETNPPDDRQSTDTAARATLVYSF